MWSRQVLNPHSTKSPGTIFKPLPVSKLHHDPSVPPRQLGQPNLGDMSPDRALCLGAVQFW